MDIILLISLTMLLLLFTLFALRITPIAPQKEITLDEQKKLRKLLGQYSGSHISHLIYLQDKELFFSTNGQVCIAFRKMITQAIVLGDPIGNKDHFGQAIQEFEMYCSKQRLRPMFYQTSEYLVSLFDLNGYRSIKIGEEAIVNLATFTLEGKQGAKSRAKFNKITRAGYTFHLLKPPYSNDFLEDLRFVSESWLGKESEKSFSVVSFDEEYVSKFPVGYLTSVDGSIAAFVTVVPNGENVIIDLMRKLPNTPYGTMETLFIHVIKWAQSKEFKQCSLGMAPFANVGNCSTANVTEKTIKMIYSHIKSTYNLQGLRFFKDRFADEWVSKRLSYKKSFLPFALLQLYVLINKTPRRNKIVVERIKSFIRRAV